MKNKVIIIYSTYNFKNLDAVDLKDGSLPPVSVEDRFYPPLGLLYLVAVLKQRNIDVSFLDMTFLNDWPVVIKDIILHENPMVAGIYVSTLNLPLAKVLIAQIKNLSPKVTVVVGGPHVHFDPDCVNYLNADYGIVSDGEFAFAELVRAIFNKSDPSGICNLVLKNGKTVSVNRLQIIENLDILPFPAREYWPYKIFSGLLSGNIASVLGSRGCAFNCAFCATPQRGEFRVRSAKNIIEELKYLSSLGVSYIDFIDDAMTVDRGRMEELCSEIIRQRLRVKWACMSRIDMVDKQLLSLMKRANCTHVKYGIESGSERVRNELMRKHITTYQIEKVLKESRQAGLATVAYFILGMPGETEDEIRQTIKFSRSKDIDYVEFRLAMLFPGSGMFNEAVQANKIPVDLWRNFANGGKFLYSILDEQTLIRMKTLRVQAMKQHYLSIPFIFKEITTRTRSISSLYNKIKILLCKKYNSYLSCKITK
ncbi:MAG: radical SAM protein [Candidatus Omnitrophica bacterium]|nr:radical SAM protein [Candidatus Omnitrophota bacterium]